jgi:hypothetical protein
MLVLESLAVKRAKARREQLAYNPRHSKPAVRGRHWEELVQ